MHYTWDEAKEASAGQPHTIAFIGYIPTVTAPEYYQRNEKRTVYLLIAKRMIKKKRAEEEETKETVGGEKQLPGNLVTRFLELHALST